MNSCFASIIMPTYNSEQWIEHTVKSILNQTYSDFEFIIIDDGSDDETLRILNFYKQQDKRIKIFTQKHNGGGVARNLGLEQAKGNYIFFLDSDDFFEENLLERCACIAKEQNPDICIYDIFEYNEILQKDNNYTTWCVRKKYLPQNNPFSSYDVKNYIFNTFSNNPWNKMFNINFLKNNNIKFQQIHRTNDLFFVCANLCLANTMFYLDEKLLHYRTHTVNSCQATNHIYPFDFIYAFNKLKEFLIKRKLYSFFNISFINHKIESSVYNLLSQNQYGTFKKLYKILKIWLENDIFSIDINYIYKKSRYNICKDIINIDMDTFINKYRNSIRAFTNK